METLGRPGAELLAELARRQGLEPDVHSGRLFGLVYPSGLRDLEQLLEEVNRRYLHGNALNTFRFPELAALEREVVEAVASLLHRPTSERQAGAMTSGGTESILLAMLAHRERARRRGIERPRIVAGESAHPAYAKAAHYLGLELDLVGLDGSWRTDPDQVRAAVGPETAVVVASAFCYPYGLSDPVEQLAAIAAEVGAGCHVDACIGGFVLPFLERLGVEVEPFDFRVPGVTTISADIHKYGYVPKGASVLCHRDDDWFDVQGFVYDRWGAGLYGSAAMAGARPAAPIACSWAAINHLGATGYTELMAEVMATTRTVEEALRAHGLALVGDPIGPVFAATSEELDLYAVADLMEARGWYLNRNTRPRGLHLMISPGHAAVVDDLVTDLAAAVNEVRREGTTAASGAARYS